MKYLNSRWNARGGRMLIAAAAIVIAGACAPRPTTAEATDGAEFEPVISMAPLGQYLAGRHAERTKDLSSAADFLSVALAADPDNPSLLLETYLLLVSEGRIDEALPLARELVELDPNSPHAWLTLAAEAAHRGDFAATAEYVSHLPVDGVNRVLVPLISGWAALEVEGIAAAEEKLGFLSGLEGAEPLRRLHLGLMYDVVGQNDKAAEIYDALAADADILSLREVQVVGNFRQRQGDGDGARALYDTFVANTGSNLPLEPAYAALEEGAAVDPVIASATDGIAESFFDVAFLLQRQQARDTSLVLLRKAVYLRPDFPIAHILLADTLAADDREEAAIEAYEEIPPSSGFGWQARLEIARTLDNLDRTDEAIALLEAMIDERPERFDAAQLLGNIYRGRERFSDAAPIYDIAVDRLGTPTEADWPLFYFRAIALERTKQWDLAEADFLKALELEPEQPFVMNYLAYSWIEQGENYDEALDMLIRAVELRPDDGFIIDSLGWVYYRLGDYENAVEQLERAVELTPTDPTINDHLGDAYWQVGRKAEARFQWRRALSFEPTPDLVATIEGKLKRGLVTDSSADGSSGG
ncbi:MAG: tetratricopeptide repeat protein [Dongiaceae bacterium]